MASLQDAAPRLTAEVDRARRHNRPLAVIVVSLDEASPETALVPMLSALLAPHLREVVRRVDIVTYTVSRSHCLLLMPETTIEGARLAQRRLMDVPAIHALLPLRWGLAAFPDDGWTLEDVIARAQAEWAAPTPAALLAIEAGR